MWWPWKLAETWRRRLQPAASQRRPDLAPADAELVRSIVKENAAVLRQRYEDQRALAAICRSDKATTAEGAASSILRARARSSREHMDRAAIYMSLEDLQAAVRRATGRTGRTGRSPESTKEDLRDALLYVESDEFQKDSAAHLAALERLADEAADNGALPGERALAALHARVVQEEVGRPSAASRLRKQVDRARQVLRRIDGGESASAAGAAEADSFERRIDLAIREHLQRAFQMGYAQSLWRGIESRLPEGVAESRGKMPPDLEREAAALAHPRWGF